MIGIERPSGVRIDDAIIASTLDEFFADFVTVAADTLQLSKPEFLRIAEVFFNMIDDGCWCDFAFELAEAAERLDGELLQPHRFPAAPAIPFGPRR